MVAFRKIRTLIFDGGSGLEFHYLLGRQSPYQHLGVEGSWNFLRRRKLGGIKKKKNTLIILQYLILL